MAQFGLFDWAIVIVYFCAMASIGPWFARRNKNTESYFVGNRSFPAWLLGFAMFATSISTQTVVGYPADAYKTAYLRLLITFTLPLGILIASFVFLPYFRRNQVTSAFEFLEGRFGPGVRLYAAIAFVIMQVARIGSILYLVSTLFEQMTGASPYMCIFAGGLVIAVYTITGGIRAIVTAQFIQAFLLWGGAILCMIMVVRGIDGGISTIITTAAADSKFIFGDPNPVTKQLEQAPWFSIQNKAIILTLLVGLNNWLTEYSSNQNVIQKYVSAKNPREATKAVWICCICSVPTWAFFMFLGTSLYVYYKLHPDPYALAILNGTEKAEKILPYFCVQNIPAGLSGLVVTGVLAAAMSASSSSVNAISAICVTDIYRRHIAKTKSDAHYVTAARIVTAFSIVLMMGGAIFFLRASTLTLQDTMTKVSSVLWGGILGIYLLGFLTKRGDGRAIGVGIVCTLTFTAYILAGEFGIINADLFIRLFNLTPENAAWAAKPINTYYTGIFGNTLMFVVAFAVGTYLGRKPSAENLSPAHTGK
jgi:SSS family solute:Na+ symporter